ncbi:hypothetical protein AB0F43_34430 [Kribbella sp. NPDC023972]|uniref:hypothetical protein n=1 Tax=Kribbella sp. NPDC023972 TaxID=3154795 RepID=UPI0033C4C675
MGRFRDAADSVRRLRSRTAKLTRSLRTRLSERTVPVEASQRIDVDVLFFAARLLTRIRP